MQDILKLLKIKNSKHFSLLGITYCWAESEDKGLQIAKEILYQEVKKDSVLYLSGGKTPVDFYSILAQEKIIDPQVIALVDERFGIEDHENSNERMIGSTGLLNYAGYKNIHIYKILDDKLSQSEATNHYDQRVRELQSLYKKHIGVLGIGVDGHTAGIPADSTVWDEYDILNRSKTEMVIDYDDHDKFYGKRVTMSFLGLSMLDLIVVLVFGKHKEHALRSLIEEGSEIDIPSRFFKRSEISKKTIIISDIDIN